MLRLFLNDSKLHLHLPALHKGKVGSSQHRGRIKLQSSQLATLNKEKKMEGSIYLNPILITGFISASQIKSNLFTLSIK